MGIDPLVVQQLEYTKHQPFTTSKIEITEKKMKVQQICCTCKV